jgi:hypothetical protein
VDPLGMYVLPANKYLSATGQIGGENPFSWCNSASYLAYKVAITDPAELLWRAKVKTQMLLEAAYQRASDMAAKAGTDEEFEKWNCEALELKYYIDNFDVAVKSVHSQIGNDSRGNPYEKGITGPGRPRDPITVTVSYMNNNSISDLSKERLLIHEVGHGAYQELEGYVNYYDYLSRRPSQEFCMTLEYEFWGKYGNPHLDHNFQREYNLWLESPDKTKYFDWRLQYDPYSQPGPWPPRR